MSLRKIREQLEQAELELANLEYQQAHDELEMTYDEFCYHLSKLQNKIEYLLCAEHIEMLSEDDINDLIEGSL